MYKKIYNNNKLYTRHIPVSSSSPAVVPNQVEVASPVERRNEKIEKEEKIQRKSRVEYQERYIAESEMKSYEVSIGHYFLVLVILKVTFCTFF